MLWASLALEKDPLQWAQLPEALMLWAQNAGGVAMLGLALWLLARTLQREPILMLPPATSPEQAGRLTTLFAVGSTIAIAGYALVLCFWLGRSLGIVSLGRWFPRSEPDQGLTIGDWILTVSGACALLVVTVPIFFSGLTRLRFGRIWALASLSQKEAIRSRVVWVFGSIVLLFLFADWFVQAKPEDQVRAYVRLVYWSISPLFLLTAALLGAFSIPTDVKNNSIHTIVTKPVEKFEIVLGRFFGYGVILTVGLFAVASLSLIYVERGVNKEAEKESHKARVTTYGNLHFAGTKNPLKGDSVGREWGYRSYITGPRSRQPNAVKQYAIWDFPSVPSGLGQRKEPIRFEYYFDIFRLSKGEEGVGVYVTFTFTDATRESQDIENLIAQMNEENANLVTEATKSRDKALKVADSPAAQKKIHDEFEHEIKETIPLTLLRKYRIYQAKSNEVTDYHTQEVKVPPEVFEVLLANRAADKPALRVFLSVDLAREAQMLGVARQDFYLVSSDRWFWQNFLKGIFGMWCTHMLVLGVAIACSTYLSGVISFLCTLFMYTAGLFNDYLREVAQGQLDGGGPTQSFIRMLHQKPIAAPLEDSPTTTVVKSLDQFFSWWIGRFMNVVPDLSRFDLHQYVANGFDIGWADILFLDNFLPLAGYLIPWAILAYYLMKYREIANPS